MYGADYVLLCLTGSKDGFSIPIKTIDEVLHGEKVTFIKADVEGFEFRVILGAEANGTNLSPNGALFHSPGQAPAPPWVLGGRGICPEGAASQTSLKLVTFGAEAVIKQNSPKWALTVYHPQNNIDEMRDFLIECNQDYKLSTKGIFDNGHPVMFQACL